MLELVLVGQCVWVMCEVVVVVGFVILVMVKCCIGVDDQDDYVDLQWFIEMMFVVGVIVLVVYVCKVWLQGLSLKENCEILLLDYGCVYQFKCEFDLLMVVINGGIIMVDEVCVYLDVVDGVMFGCVVYYDFYLLVQVELVLYGELLFLCEMVLVYLCFYVEVELVCGIVIKYIIRYLFGFYQGQFGVCSFCCVLSEGVYLLQVGWSLLEQVFDLVCVVV